MWVRRTATVLCLIELGVAPAALADPAGFVCPDHSVVTSAEQCPTAGNKYGSNNGGPAPFPGGGGGGGSGGLLGAVGGLLHKVTGGLL